MSQDDRAARYTWNGETDHEALEVRGGSGKILANIEDLIAQPGLPELPEEESEEEEPRSADTRDNGVSSVSAMKKFHDLNVVIENPAGSIRRGRNWEVIMPADYGYIRRHEGADGDQIDCHVGPNPASKNVLVIDQCDPDSKAFDEHKIMLGFNSTKDALNTYRSAYDSRADDRIMGFYPLTMDMFKEWLDFADLKKPFGENY